MTDILLIIVIVLLAVRVVQSSPGAVNAIRNTRIMLRRWLRSKFRK